MGIRIVQAAKPGERTDVVLIYHAHPIIDPKVKAAWPEAAIGNETMEAFKGHYGRIGGADLTPLVAACEKLGVKWSNVRNLILVGFSEGCQALRTFVLSGAIPSAMLAVDGVHNMASGNGTIKGHESGGVTMDFTVRPWRVYAEAAEAKMRVLTITHSDIVPINVGSTTMMARIILAPRSESPVAPGTEISGVSPFRLLTMFKAGDFRVFGYSGGNEAAHTWQLQTVLPLQLGLIRERVAGREITPIAGTGATPVLGKDQIALWDGPKPVPPSTTQPVDYKDPPDPPSPLTPPIVVEPPQPVTPKVPGMPKVPVKVPVPELPRSQVSPGGAGGVAAVFIGLLALVGIGLRRSR